MAAGCSGACEFKMAAGATECGLNEFKMASAGGGCVVNTNRHQVI